MHSPLISERRGDGADGGLVVEVDFDGVGDLHV